MKERIAVLGWYGKDNTGDQSYTFTLPALYPGFDFQFVDDLKNAQPFDYLVMGGGNVIDQNFFDQLESVKVPKFLFSVGIPAKDDARRPHLYLLPKLKQFQHICVRDHISFDLLSKKGYNVHFLPDFAFVLQPNKERGKELIKQIYKRLDGELYEKVVVVTLNSFLAAGHEMLARDYVTFQKVCFDIAKCADTTPASFLFLPFGGDQLSDDRLANGWCAGRCKWYKKNVVVYDRLSVQDTLDIISACDATISTRLHASIFSTIGGVPFVDLTHHDKNLVYLQSIGKKKWSLDYWFLDYHSMYDMINSFLTDKGILQQELLLTSSVYRHMLLNNVSRFLKPMGDNNGKA